MSQETLKASAVGFGFDSEWVAKVIEDWGDDTLTVAIEAARHGITVPLVVEILQKFGPRVLELLVTLLNRYRLMGVAGDVLPGQVVEGVDAAMIDVIVDKWLPLIVQKYLPMIMEKYGEQLIKWVIDFLLNSLTKK